VPVISTKSVAALARQDSKHAVNLLLPLYCLTNLADVYSSKREPEYYWAKTS
jgi:hypothetical protein